MELSKVKAVVFDCDGVMFDTALSNRKFYDEILDAFGKPELTEEQFINVHMMTVTAAIEYLFPEFGDHLPVYDKIRSIGYAKFIPYMQREKGLITLLGRLKEEGFIRGVATNRTNTMESVLEDNQMTAMFETVVTAADVKNPKPAPDQLQKIMDKFDLLPEEILFIGDSEYDRKAALAAGTWFVAFKNMGLEAHAHVTSMGELAGLLNINE